MSEPSEPSDAEADTEADSSGAERSAPVPIVIPWKGHVVVAVVCVVAAIFLAAQGGAAAIAAAIVLVVLAAVDVLSALRKRRIVEG